MRIIGAVGQIPSTLRRTGPSPGTGPTHNLDPFESIFLAGFYNSSKVCAQNYKPDLKKKKVHVSKKKCQKVKAVVW